MPAYVRKVKRGKGQGLWGSYVVERDESGSWLYTPANSLYQGTIGCEVSYCYAGWPEPPGAPVIHLIPTSGWWFARWQDTAPGPHVAIDICTPTRLDGDVWSYDDLELDLFKFKDGRFGITDVDEFDEARASGHITEDEAEISLATLADLSQRLADGDELFDQRGWQLFDHYGRQSFDPLVTFPK